MDNKHFLALGLTATLLTGCKEPEAPVILEPVIQLPKQLKENSGIVMEDGKHFWSLNDSGNKNAIYQIDSDGNTSQTIAITDLKNNDWEEITKDSDGSLYIGDFGNNENTRKDLGIYKITHSDLDKPQVSTVQQTTFVYPEQESFPPKKKELVYDCEAFFEMDGHFYLFTKNRSKDFDGTTLLYKIPNAQGNFKARLMGSYKTCENFNGCAITGAAISPDKKKVVLLGHASIWLIEDFKNDDFLNGKITQFDLGHDSQKEAVCFKDNETLLIADERVKKQGGMVYEVSLRKLKTKS